MFIYWEFDLIISPRVDILDGYLLLRPWSFERIIIAFNNNIILSGF